MALGDTVSFVSQVLGFDVPKTVKPAGIVSQWIEAISAGGPATSDNSGGDITVPSTQIDAATRRVIDTAEHGTMVAVRLGYDDELTSITDPVVQLFGRYGEGEPWQLLPSMGDSTEATLATAASDAGDGTLLYTTVAITDNVFDLMGCRELLVGVKTPLAGTGTTSNAIIETKLLN